MRALHYYTAKSKRSVTVEYVLFNGVNDSPEDARRLVRLLRGLPAKVNLIPMNAHADAPYRAPAPEVASRFLGEQSSGRLGATGRREASGNLSSEGPPGGN